MRLGYEPEVLLGAKDSLKICDYVAVDGGYERGLKEQTFTEITNYLIKNGFEIDIYFPWNRALLKIHYYQKLINLNKPLITIELQVLTLLEL